jgi:hypothetical protein
MALLFRADLPKENVWIEYCHDGMKYPSFLLEHN